MDSSTRTRGLRPLHAVGALLLCGGITWATVGLGAAGAQTASASAATTGKCTKARAKINHSKDRTVKKRHLRCSPHGSGTNSGAPAKTQGGSTGSGKPGGSRVTGATGGSGSPSPSNPNCPLAHTGSSIGMTLPSSCTIDRVDTAADPDAHDLWGARYACADDSRVTNPQTGGDLNPTASGAPQGNSAYRKLTVYDGDNYSGERCELAYNEWDGGLSTPSDQYGTFYNYFEGDRRTTYFSVRLPDNFPLNATKWQGVGQMKQAAPNDSTTAIPVLSFSAYNGVWSFWHTANDAQSDTELWKTPARKNVWTRIRVDGYYSQYSNLGWVQYSVDSNGDGDFADPGEVSPVFHTNTLLRNGTGSSNDELPAGDSIPSHLRLGLYHDPSIACPGSCSVDIDNVEVAKP